MEDSLKVSNLIETGRWKLNKISFQLPLSIINAILGSPFSHMNKEDKLIWDLSKYGSYSSESAYISLKCFDNQNMESDFKWIWKIPLYTEIPFFHMACCS